MKRTKTKLLCLLLAALMLLGLTACGKDKESTDKELADSNLLKLGEEIRQALTQVRKDVREKIEQAAAPKAAVTCPYCGATTTPDANGCCEYCGGAVNG